MIDEQTLVGVIAGYDTTSARWRAAAVDELVANGIDVEGDPALAVYLRDGVRNARVTLAAPENPVPGIPWRQPPRQPPGRAAGERQHGLYRRQLPFQCLVLRSRQDGDLIAIGDRRGRDRPRRLGIGPG